MARKKSGDKYLEKGRELAAGLPHPVGKRVTRLLGRERAVISHEKDKKRVGVRNKKFDARSSPSWLSGIVPPSSDD